MKSFLFLLLIAFSSCATISQRLEQVQTYYPNSTVYNIPYSGEYIVSNDKNVKHVTIIGKKVISEIVIFRNTNQVDLPEEPFSPDDTLRGWYDAQRVLHIEFNNGRNR